MNEREVVAKFFGANPQWKINANIGFLIDKSAKPLSVENLSIAALALRDTLLLAPEYEDAWQDCKFYQPGETGLAHRAIFIEKLRAKEQQEIASKESEVLIRQLGDKFRGQSLERLREVAEKRRVHRLTASQFKQEREATALKKVRQYDGFPVLPEYLVLPGQVQATKIDAVSLLALVRTDYYFYKRLVNKYGGQQITDRQNTVNLPPGE
jgi:hypothetical protein